MDDLKVANVIPIEKGVFKDSLTYFTSQKVKVGSVVAVPLRRKEILAVVTSVNTVEEMKIDLKASEFPFKKIEKILADNLFLPEFIYATKDTAEYFASITGQVIRLLSPKAILNSWKKLEATKAEVQPHEVEPQLPASQDTVKYFEPLLLQLPDEERYPFYKSLIREEFAKKHSVMFILPTVHDVLEAGEVLKKGIEEYAVLFHGQMSAKSMNQKWQMAVENPHPMLIVSTPIFMSLPRSDLSTIIMDKEFSPFYKTQGRPFIDIRKFAEFYARRRQMKLILGDSILRVEDIYQGEAGVFIPTTPLKFRFPRAIEQELIDMKKKSDAKEKKLDETFILSDKLKHEIKNAISNKENFVIISARKGLATSTVCSDCGTVINCENCAIPLVLYKNGKETIFSCNQCNQKKSSDVKCAVCTSWKLKVLGVGTEKTEEEIRNAFPDAKVFRLDGESAKSYKAGAEIIKNFYATRGAILIATEMALGYLKENVDNSAIASIDSLFALPDFQIGESIFNLLMRLKLKTNKRFFIQTRKSEDKIFENVMRGDVLEFYRKEIRERKKWNYPPFKVLIKITSEGPREVVREEMEQLGKFLSKYEPTLFNSRGAKVRGHERINLLVKCEPADWPKKEKQVAGPSSAVTSPAHLPDRSGSVVRAGGTRGEFATEITSEDGPSVEETVRGLASHSEDADNREEQYSSLLEILLSLPPRFTVKINPDSIL